jgi:hypothetical protein
LLELLVRFRAVAASPENTRMSNRVITPRERIDAECRRRGMDEVAAHCVDLLSGRDVEDAFLLVLGGPHAANVLNGFDGGKQGYWPRVWAARGLLSRMRPR